MISDHQTSKSQNYTLGKYQTIQQRNTKTLQQRSQFTEMVLPCEITDQIFPMWAEIIFYIFFLVPVRKNHFSTRDLFRQLVLAVLMQYAINIFLDKSHNYRFFFNNTQFKIFHFWGKKILRTNAWILVAQEEWILLQQPRKNEY